MRGRAIAKRLSETDLLAGLSPIKRQAAMAVLMSGRMERWAAGQAGALHTGSAGLLLVKSGECEVVVTTEDHRSLVLAEASDGEVLTCAPSGLDECEVELRALTDVVLCPLDHEHLRGLAPYPTVLTGLLEQCARRAEEAQGAALRLAHRRVEDRVLLALRSLASRQGRVTRDGVKLGAVRHQDIARRANVTRPGATQALARLEREGRIRREPDGGLVLPPLADDGGSLVVAAGCRRPSGVPRALARILRR
ncbi:MAG: Crp/Fnr family transcriptional regulator [Actinomycetota bacterium]